MTRTEFTVPQGVDQATVIVRWDGVDSTVVYKVPPGQP